LKKQPLIFRIFQGESLLEVKQFDKDQIVLGRPGSEVDILLEHDSVSPIHALIEKREDQYYICDLGSQSGVYVQGRPILDEAIASGETIHLGVYRIEFYVGIPKPKITNNPSFQAPSSSTAAVVPPPVSSAPVSEVSDVTAAPSAEATKANVVTASTSASQSSLAPVAEKVSTQEASIASAGVIAEIPPESGSKSLLSSAASPNTKPKAHIPKGEENNKKQISNRKKATFSGKSEISSLSAYLTPSSGKNIQVVYAWKERVLEVYNFSSSKTLVTLGADEKSDLKLPKGLASNAVPFLRRLGDEVEVLIPQNSQVRIITEKVTFSGDDLKKMGRLQPSATGTSVRIKDNEILHLIHESGLIEMYIRNTPETSAIKPVGFLDISSTELTGMIISLILVSLVALYMSVYTPEPKEELPVEEVRLAQFVYNRPPTPKLPEPPPEPTPIPTPEPTPVAIKPTPTPVPKKVQVTDKKIEAPAQTKPKAKAAGGAKALEVRAKPNQMLKPAKMTSTQQGGAVKLGDNEGANAASKDPDVSQTGLLSAFGGGGNRSRLDKAYSGSGELLGMANKATGYSGQNTDRAGSDLGSKFKDDGAGGKGIATQGIANIGTKGRSTGMNAYGAVGSGSGKGRVSIDVPGSNAEFIGSIDREAVRRVIRSIVTQIRSCYEKQLKLNPALAGKLVITFEIAEAGKVRSARAKSNELGDTVVGECVSARISAQRFPEPPEGTIAVVDYPFVFDAQK